MIEQRNTAQHSIAQHFSIIRHCVWGGQIGCDEAIRNTRHLDIVLRVPVAIEYHHCVSSCEVDPYSSRPGGQEKYE
jgi:hypothetical protein